MNFIRQKLIYKCFRWFSQLNSPQQLRNKNETSYCSPTARGLPHVLSMGYPLVGGTRERYFAGASLKPSKQLENAQTPTTLARRILPGFGCIIPAHFRDVVLGAGL